MNGHELPRILKFINSWRFVAVGVVVEYPHKQTYLIQVIHNLALLQHIRKYRLIGVGETCFLRKTLASWTRDQVPSLHDLSC